MISSTLGGRHSIDEAQRIFSEFRNRSVDQLSPRFTQAGVPDFADIAGESAGIFLAKDPACPAWLHTLAELAFSKKVMGWKGKLFTQQFAEGEKGRGANLFASRIVPIRYHFDTYITRSLYDGKPCLRLEYDSFPSPVWGTMDELRMISEGVFLGRGYYRFPWRQRYQMVAYFMLCALQAPEASDTADPLLQRVPVRATS